MLLASAILLPTVLLVLLAVLVCLLLVATLALVVVMERTGADVPATAAGLRQRLRRPSPAADQPAGPSAEPRTPWSQRTPDPAPAPAVDDEAPTVQMPAAPAPAPAPARTRTASATKAPATRTRPVRTPKAPAATAEDGDRQAAMDRLFAPLSEERDRTE